MDKEKAIKDVCATLDKANIKYDINYHEAVYTIDEINAKGLDKENIIAKNLFLRNAKGDKHYLVSIKKEKTADLKKMKEELSSTRLSFASEERLFNNLALEKGEVTPFGVLNNKDKKVIVAFDKDLKLMDKVGFHPNSNSATVFLSLDDVIKIVKANGNEVLLINI